MYEKALVGLVDSALEVSGRVGTLNSDSGENFDTWPDRTPKECDGAWDTDDDRENKVPVVLVLDAEAAEKIEGEGEGFGRASEGALNPLSVMGSLRSFMMLKALL